MSLRPFYNVQTGRPIACGGIPFAGEACPPCEVLPGYYRLTGCCAPNSFIDYHFDGTNPLPDGSVLALHPDDVSANRCWCIDRTRYDSPRPFVGIISRHGGGHGSCADCEATESPSACTCCKAGATRVRANAFAGGILGRYRARFVGITPCSGCFPFILGTIGSRSVHLDSLDLSGLNDVWYEVGQGADAFRPTITGQLTYFDGDNCSGSVVKVETNTSYGYAINSPPTVGLGSYGIGVFRSASGSYSICKDRVEILAKNSVCGQDGSDFSIATGGYWEALPCWADDEIDDCEEDGGI